MTISSTVRIAGPYIGSGAATVFPFAFKVFAAAEMQVAKLNTTSNVETILTLTTDYTVQLNGDQNGTPGGTITLPAVLSSGYNLTITSDIANLQPTDLTNQGGFYPEVITDALDRATIQIQQLDQNSRAIKIPLSDGVLDMTTPVVSARQGKYLAFDTFGLPVVSSGTGSDSALRTDLANATAVSAGSRLSGFRQTGTGATARTVDDKLKDTVSVKDFGAVGDGVTDDSAALQLAIDNLPSAGGKINISQGSYLFSNQININKPLTLVLDGATILTTSSIGFNHTASNFTIVGSGDNISIIKHSGTNHCISSTASSSASGKFLGRIVVENVGIEDLLTTQTSASFLTWSTTRIQGSGIYSTSPMCDLENVNIFGFYDAVHVTNILASVWDSVRSAWSVRDGLYIGHLSTSVTLNSCYTFAPQRDGIHFEDSVLYTTLNSTASDSSGRYAYFFGQGSSGFSPQYFTLNSIGCEEASALNTTNGSSIYLSGVNGFVFNSPFITGYGTRLANTISGIRFDDLVSTGVSINSGTFGINGSALGKYGLYVVSTKYAGKLTIIGNPSYYTTDLNVKDDDSVIEYLSGNQPDNTTFRGSESTNNGATPTYLSFFDAHVSNTITTYKINIIGKQISGGGGTIGQGCSYIFYHTFRNIAGVVTDVGTTVFAYTVENDATWNVSLQNDSGGARIQVTGALNEQISWQYSVVRTRI